MDGEGVEGKKGERGEGRGLGLGGEEVVYGERGERGGGGKSGEDGNRGRQEQCDNNAMSLSYLSSSSYLFDLLVCHGRFDRFLGVSFFLALPLLPLLPSLLPSPVEHRLFQFVHCNVPMP